jgi:hypothetical protein
MQVCWSIPQLRRPIRSQLRHACKSKAANSPMLLQSKKTVTAAPDTTLLIIGFSPCDPIPGHIKANSSRGLNRFQAPDDDGEDLKSGDAVDAMTKRGKASHSWRPGKRKAIKQQLA